MKTYTRRKELTRTEAAQLLIANNWEPIEGCEFFDRHGDGDTLIDELSGVSAGAFTFDAAGCTYWKHCAKIEQVNPRDVPEGCTRLPEDKPWLAFISDGPAPILDTARSGAVYANTSKTLRGSIWLNGPMPVDGSDDTYYAIDVRTEFAKEHFPEIVACFADEPFMQPEPRYGYTDDGELIVAPEGWEIVPEGEGVDCEHRIVYYDGDICKLTYYDKDTAKILDDARAFIRRKPPERLAKGHNPAGLTEAQVGVDEGWRLLERDEVAVRGKTLGIEMWILATRLWDGSCDGGEIKYTYRTNKPAGYFLPEIAKGYGMNIEGYLTGPDRWHLDGTKMSITIDGKRYKLTPID